MANGLRRPETGAREGVFEMATRRRRVTSQTPPADTVRVQDPIEVEVDRAPVFVAREGDTLHVRYPEMTVPLKTKYASAKIGGMTLTRQLVAGDDIEEQGIVMATVLKKIVTRVAKGALRDVNADLEGAETR